MIDDDGCYPVFNNGQCEEVLPESVIAQIGALIKRDTVQSVSCPFNNSKVWHMLVSEQVLRAKQTGKSPQEAFNLSGPDSGFSFDPTDWGGVVHIPYEGACVADLFVAPAWRNFYRETNHATLSSDYHHLIASKDLGELSCAIRHDIGDGWFYYESSRPYVALDNFGNRLSV